MKQGYVAALDPLRFGAALAVVFYHYVFHDVPGMRMAGALTEYGYLGVPLFFMISGFVISMSIEGAVSPLHFLLHRAIRLYPAFILCAAITVLYVARFAPSSAYSAREILLNLTMFGGRFGARLINGSYWSLAVEWTFYLLVAASVALFGKRRLAHCLWAWWALAALNVVVPLRLLAKPLLLGSAPLFIAGAALYLIMSGTRRAQMWLLFVCSLPVALYWARSDARHLGLPGAHSLAVVSAATLGFYLLMAVIAVRGAGARRPHALLRAAGASSYPLYLLHETIGEHLLARAGGGHPAFVVGLVVAMVLLAWAIAEYYERPVQRWLRGRSARWFAGPPADTPARARG